MAMVQSLDHYWTPEEVRALPDDGTRHECIDGVLIVRPAPKGLHQRAIALLWDSLSPYVRRERVGELLSSPADVEIEPRVASNCHRGQHNTQGRKPTQ